MSSGTRVGKLVVATVLVGVMGCNQNTEIPLAKVPPVTVPPPQAPSKALKGLSPANLNEPPGGR